jgi:hypothetical protein
MRVSSSIGVHSRLLMRIHAFNFFYCEFVFKISDINIYVYIELSNIKIENIVIYSLQ